MTMASTVAEHPASLLGKVTVIVVNYNSGQWLKRCVRALKGKGARWPQIIVLDNASSDGSLDELPEMPGLDLVHSEQNLGFARGVNRAAAMAETPYLLIINPDCLLVPDALVRLVQELDLLPDVALVSGRIFDMSGNEQRGSRRQLVGPRRVLNELLPFRTGNGVDLTHLPPPNRPVDVEATSGACMLIRRSAFESLGGLDEGYPMHFEDLDFMARLQQAGWRIRLLPDVAISHAGGVSSRTRPVGVMLDKHRGLWRYLTRHCRDRWPAWQRPLWALGIGLHALLMVPVLFWRR